ncbi:hypothetical protein OSB04_027677 [Centaurea solstitialis]|uniref:BED-type domain-containing protein n=1 Tax=Centaurea solstitialis TaxID=347529 RepID=A0AA38SSL1_9ASTR|nr:hypothetical protein OSB04_027677 [Centaurea solstitialis]
MVVVVRDGQKVPDRTGRLTGDRTKPGPVRTGPESNRSENQSIASVTFQNGRQQHDPNDQIAEIITDHGRKAEVWKHFNIAILVTGKRKAQCKGCGNLLTSEGNSTLKRHIENSCAALKAQTGPNQPILDNTGQVWMYSADLCRQMTTSCVIQSAMPFGMFTNPHLTKLIQKALQPRYNPVSRQTLRRDGMQAWEKAKNETRELFSNLPNNVSLTCDVWSAPNGLPESYLCITAHWVDPISWLLCKRIITFSFDNASNNNRCVDKLKLALNPILDGQIFHTRCCAHIINLAVQDGLETCKRVLNKFRLMLRRIFNKGKKMQQAYRKYCKDVGFRALGPAHDMPVRWNSTYYMLDNLVKQKQYIHAFYNIHYEKNTIGSQDWAIIEGLHDILNDFKNATTLLSGIYYPKSPLLLNQLYILSSKIVAYEDHHDWGTLMASMKAKLLKYFLEIPFGFLCAAALNPYLNVIGVEVLITNICQAFGLDTSTEHIRLFNVNFQRLFDHYKNIYGVEANIKPLKCFRRVLVLVATAKIGPI